MYHAIGIDIGTTNCKVVLCELPSCSIVHLVTFASPKRETQGQVDFDVRSMLGELSDALRACRLAADADPIGLISIASVGESGVLVRSDGLFDGFSIAWFDRRGESYASTLYRDGSAEHLYGITGIPAHSNYSLFKLLWMRDHGARLKGSTWLSLGDFVAWWLCGEYGSDESLASRSFSLDLIADEFSGEILDRFGLDCDLFPPVVESGTVRGSLRDEVAAETGINRCCRVCVGGHDHMVGSVACDLKPGVEILNSTGTSEGILTLNPAPVLTKGSFSQRISNGRYVRPRLFSYYASLPTAGYALAWLAKLLGIDAAPFFNEMFRTMYQDYLRGAFERRELLFVPHLRGSGPPRRSVDALGCLYGMRDSSTREDLIYSTNLGLVLELNNLYLTMIGDSNRGALKVIGPAACSELWMQLKADVLGMEAHACRVREPVARGAVMLAAQKMGCEVRLEFGCDLYTCDEQRHAYFEDLFIERYRPLCDALAALEHHQERSFHAQSALR